MVVSSAMPGERNRRRGARMRIEHGLIANCSDYTISLYNLSVKSRIKIKELENDLEDINAWAESQERKLPKAPDWMKNLGNDNWSKWNELPEIQAYHAELRKHWKGLEDKYSVKEGTIFDTSIRGFHWIDKKTLDIPGYLNEGNLVTWLEEVAKVNKMIVR